MHHRLKEAKMRGFSGGGKEVEEAFHKSVDLIPSQLAFTIHSVDKADRHLWRRVDHNFTREKPQSPTSPIVRPNCLALTIISIWKTYPLDTVAATNLSKTWKNMPDNF